MQIDPIQKTHFLPGLRQALADHHYHHDVLIKFCCNRSVWNEKHISIFNRHVTPFTSHTTERKHYVAAPLNSIIVILSYIMGLWSQSTVFVSELYCASTKLASFTAHVLPSDTLEKKTVWHQGVWVPFCCFYCQVHLYFICLHRELNSNN